MNNKLFKSNVIGKENTALFISVFLLLFIGTLFKISVVQNNIVSWGIYTHILVFAISVLVVAFFAFHKAAPRLFNAFSDKAHIAIVLFGIVVVINLLYAQTINGRYRLLEPILLLAPLLLVAYRFKEPNPYNNLFVLSGVYIFSAVACYITKTYLQWVILFLSYVFLMATQAKICPYSKKHIYYAVTIIITTLSLVMLFKTYFLPDDRFLIQSDFSNQEYLTGVFRSIRWLEEGMSFSLPENAYIGFLTATKFGFLYIAAKYGLLFLLPIVVIYCILFYSMILNIQKETTEYFQFFKYIIFLIFLIECIFYLLANLGIPLFYYNSMPLLFNDSISTCIHSLLIGCLFVK